MRFAFIDWLYCVFVYFLWYVCWYSFNDCHHTVMQVSKLCAFSRGLGIINKDAGVLKVLLNFSFGWKQVTWN